ncbi:MAG: AI-2E family transporter [Nanoarchaeota archaeon]|nr:AI-2E family transporter [Nanoarchaeota archaeon]
MGEKSFTDYVIYFIGAVLFFLVLKELSSILRPLVLAFFITALLMPLYEFARKKKIPAAIPLAGVFILILVAFYLLGGLLTSEISRFENNKDYYQDQINSTIQLVSEKSNMHFDEFNLETLLTSKAGNKVVSTSVSALGNIFSELFLALLFVAFMIPSYRRMIQALSHKNRQMRITLMKIQTSVIDYLRTKTVISLGTAVSSALVLTFFHSDFIWTLSIIIFLFNFVPNIGSIVATIFASAIYLLKFGWGVNFIILFALLSLIQMIWGNFIEPAFAGKQLKLSPLLIIISLFFWGWLWGIGGMILSIPILAIVKITLEHFEETKHLAEYLQ